MIRVLLIHNFYQDKGGEDVVFEQEARLLSEVAEVETLRFRNHRGAKGFWEFLRYPVNKAASAKVRQVVKRFKPDVIHVHNLHYALGPDFIRVVHRMGVPLVMTLHNYRILCPSATLYHKQRVFRESLKEPFPWTAVRQGVHNGSRIKTFWIAAVYFLHRKLGTWNMVSRYLSLTEFAREVFLSSAAPLSSEKVTVKPNFLPDPLQHPAPASERAPHFLFVGRLSGEKGVELLLRTFRDNTLHLRIAGTGPLQALVEQTCREHPARLEFLGALSREEVLNELRLCDALVFPSLWYEGMPMTLIEAFACGTPVIASDLGAMREMVTPGKNGWLFKPGDTKALQRELKRHHELSRAQKQHLFESARDTYNAFYTPSHSLRLLTDVYTEAIRERL